MHTHVYLTPLICIDFSGGVMLVRICMANSLCMPFKVRPGVLSKTLSYICGKLNLPIFLFNMGLFTLINIDSLIFLAKQGPQILWSP